MKIIALRVMREWVKEARFALSMYGLSTREWSVKSKINGGGNTPNLIQKIGVAFSTLLLDFGILY